MGLAVTVAVGGCSSSSSSSDAMREGKSFVEKGELTAAVVAFKNAVQAEPSGLDARVALGDVLERTGDLSGAEQQYRRAVELGGDASDLVPKIAIILLDRNDLLTLVRDFGDKELAFPASDSDLRGIVAVAQLILGEKPKALAQLAKATVETPAVRLARAQLALREGRSQDAATELERALNEGTPPWWVRRAASRVYWARGDADKALAAMKGAYEAAGTHPEVIGEYAEKLFRSGRSADAKPLVDRLRQIAPRHYRIAVLDALIQMESGHFEEAYASATRVLTALPDHLPSQLIAAKIEMDRGELSTAESRIRKILAQSPQLVEALRMRFMLELRRGDNKAAGETLEKALRLAPNDKGLLAAAADLAWAKGDKPGAIKQLSIAVQTPPVQAGLLARLAEMKNTVGKRDEAAAAIGQAIELSERQPQSREAVLRAAMRMRFSDKAKAMVTAELARRPKDPEPIMWMAAVLGSQGDATGALAQIRLALDTRADYYPALFALGKLATAPEQAKEYDERLEKAVQTGGKDARIYLERVLRLRLAGADAEQVGTALDRGIKADPGSAALREAAVRHWLATGRKDKALTLATDGEAAQPDSVALIALAAATNEAVGNHELAVTKYGQLSARFPDRLDWALKHAQSLVRAGRPTEAITALRKLISSRADEPAPYRLLAMLQMDQKQKEEALLTAGMLRDRPKLRASGMLLQGDIHAQAGDKDEALKAYSAVAKSGASDVALVRKIELLDRTGGQAFADGELKDWLTTSPNSIPALSLAAKRAVARQDHGAAARYLETIIKLEPANATALNDLAWSYAQSRNPAALAVAKKASELSPDNAQILDTLAEAQVLAGQRNEAVANLRRALALVPGLPSARVHLAELLAADGNKKGAADLLRDIDERSLDKEAAARLQAVKGRL